MSRETTVADSEKVATGQLIIDCKRQLDLARAERDKLKIALAESALNDLLERY